jgi:GT2 family glycosyltransferase
VPVPRTSVLVVSHRPGEWLKPCLDSVVGQADEVIVVDNASEGAVASAVAAAAGARRVRSPVNRGFAGGVALGLEAARGELIGVLNDDAVAGDGWLASAARVLSDPEVAAVTPKVVLAGGWLELCLARDQEWTMPGEPRILGRKVRTLQLGGVDLLVAAVGGGIHGPEAGPDGQVWRWSRGSRPFYVPDRWTPRGETAPGVALVNGEEVPVGPSVRLVNHAGSYLMAHGLAGEYGLGAPDDGRFDQPREPFGFSGTAPVFRAETLARLGSFAPQYFAYNEDTDWCLRARLAGMRIAYDPEAVVEHRLSATSGGGASPWVRMLAERNAVLCLVRTAPARLARPELTRRLRLLPEDALARSILRRLPWAVSSRLAMSRRWALEPGEVWDHWVGRDSTWDLAPARA